MFQLFQQRDSGDMVPIRQVVMDTLENIEKASKTTGSVTGTGDRIYRSGL